MSLSPRMRNRILDVAAMVMVNIAVTVFFGGIFLALRDSNAWWLLLWALPPLPFRIGVWFLETQATL